MPQGGSETFFAGGDADDRQIDSQPSSADREPLPLEESDDQPEVPPDFPPESFWLSKDAEFDWFDRNAFFERKESTKASSNSTNLNPNLNSQSNSNSQRFSLNLKSKASIIGLPKPQNTSYVDAKNRRHCKSGNIRLFPKRSGSGGKSVSSLIEPSSPKVSCIGKVRSKKDRNRRKNRHHSSEIPAAAHEKTAEGQKKGFFASFRALFRSGGKRQPVVEPTASVVDSPPRDSATVIARGVTRADDNLPPTESLARKSIGGEPAGLGNLQRFASGRKSGSWVVGDAV